MLLRSISAKFVLHLRYIGSVVLRDLMIDRHAQINFIITSVIFKSGIISYFEVCMNVWCGVTFNLRRPMIPKR